MTTYWILFWFTFALINIAELYRCKRLAPLDIAINGAVSFIPVINLLVMGWIVHWAINKA